MKNTNNGCIEFVIVVLVLALGIKLCTNKQNNINAYTPASFDNSRNTFKDGAVSNEPGGATNYYLVPYKKSKKKNTRSSGSRSGDCLSSQCYAATKKGARCRNITKNCSGYCWRHGG